MTFGSFVRSGVQRSLRNQSGQVAVIFALSLLPMLAVVGLGVDFGRASILKIQLNNAADEAALSAVSASSNPQMILPSQSSIQKYFNAAAGALPPGTTYSVSSTATTSVTSLFVTINYSATVPTLFGKLVGVPTLQIGGTSSAAGQLPTYVDFYLLLDNSPSMGLGATASDIQNLQNLTPDQCAFACHQHTFTNGMITGDNLNDYYHVAKNNGITTRIDVLRTATQSLTTTATQAETVPNQFRMAVYTFSDTFQTIANLTNNLSSVQSNASAIDLAYAYNDQRDAQTSYDTSLSYINSGMPLSGDGSSSSKPMEFIFLVTDGVQDEPVNSGSGTGDPPDPWASGTSGASTNTQPNLSSALQGNVSSTRLITAMSQSNCDSIKSRGVKIAILYTTYLPVTNNGFYNQWVAPISSNIPTQLQACASPGFYFQISPTQGIASAMQAMFTAALTEARLTN